MFKSLYSRIAVYTITVMFLSALISFLATNVYYHFNLKPSNDSKIIRTLQEAKQYQEQNDIPSLTHYFEHLGEMNYQLLTVSEDGDKKFYGEHFREDNIKPEAIHQVLDGHDYHEIKNQPYEPFITGFFDNVTSNTVGVPFYDNGKTIAVFMRPDIGQTFSEFRIFLAVLLILLLTISIILVIASTYAIIKPVQQLKKATEHLMEGDFDTPIRVTRQDELGILQRHFDIMRVSLKQLDDMRQHFVQNVSHEIKTPLTHIHHLLNELKRTTSQAKREQYIDEIYQVTSQLSDLTKELLLLAELDNANHLKFEDEVQLDQLLTQIIRHNQFAADQKDIVVLSDLEPVRYQGNLRLLHQALQNFITNAIKYSPHEGWISVELGQNAQTVTCRISDNGKGMTTETQQRLFERFYKVSRHDNSNGLGLAIAKTIIELHAGRIHVESTIGEGTTFTIELPLPPTPNA